MLRYALWRQIFACSSSLDEPASEMRTIFKLSLYACRYFLYSLCELTACFQYSETLPECLLEPKFSFFSHSSYSLKSPSAEVVLSDCPWIIWTELQYVTLTFEPFQLVQPNSGQSAPAYAMFTEVPHRVFGHHSNNRAMFLCVRCAIHTHAYMGTGVMGYTLRSMLSCYPEI